MPGTAGAQAGAPGSATESQQRTPAEAERIELNRKLEAQEVTERKQEGYSPLGIHAGGFTLHPGLDVALGFTDNLYSTSNNEKSDFFTTINPSLFIQSNWNVHSLEFWGSGRFERFFDYSAENSDNFDVFARGKIDVVRGTWFAIKPSYVLDHEKRSSPDAIVGGDEPVRVSTKALEFNAEHKPNRLWFQADAGIRDIGFSDSRLANGTFINNADRDRTELTGGLRAGYEVTPGYSAFVEGRANDRSYDSSVDDFGFRRDSHGYEGRVGAQLELTGKLRGDVFIGYMWQNYADSRFETLSAPIFGAGLVWNATGLTTVKLNIARTIEETTVQRSAGNLQNSVELSVDHELQRNIILSAAAKYMRQDFRSIDRDDDVIEARLRATYLINHIYKLYGNYTYATRDSNAALSDYDINTVSVGVAALF